MPSNKGLPTNLWERIIRKKIQLPQLYVTYPRFAVLSMLHVFDNNAIILSYRLTAPKVVQI